MKLHYRVTSSAVFDGDAKTLTLMVGLLGRWIVIFNTGVTFRGRKSSLLKRLEVKKGSEIS